MYIGFPISLMTVVSTKTSNYSVVVADQWNIIHIDNSGTAIDITLPDPSTVSVGKVFRFKAVWNSSNTVRFIPFGAESIDLIAGAYTWSNPYKDDYTDISSPYYTIYIIPYYYD